MTTAMIITKLEEKSNDIGVSKFQLKHNFKVQSLLSHANFFNI